MREFFAVFAVFLGLSSLSAPLHGRWAKKDDEASSINKAYYFYKIRADGTYTVRIEQQVEVLRDDARASEGLVRLRYKPDSESFRLVEAYTLNEKKREDVPRDTVEDKPLATDGEGFDQTNQMTVVFPDVKVGSKLCLTIEREYKAVQIPNFFSEYLFFGGALYKDIQVQIESELPLYAEVSDPTKSLKLKVSKKHLSLRSREPIHRRVIDEVEFVLNPSTHHWLLVSTQDQWQDFAEPIISEYEQVLAAPVPKAFEHILKLARKMTSIEDRINSVTSQLATHLRYHGDWRSVRGRNIPRPLAQIARTRFGDCKDFSAVTTSLLRRLGISANLAWVNRSFEPDFTPRKLPHSLFNHAIVRAEAEGKIFWIDPTNSASFAQGVFEDIIDRPALVLRAPHSSLEVIPPGIPSSSSIEEFQEVFFGNRPKVRGKIHFSGREASNESGLTKESSPESLRHHFIDLISRDVPISYWQLSSLELNSRITKDFDIPFEYSPKLSNIATSAGHGYRLPTPRRISGIFDLRSDRVSDYFIAQPMTLTSEIHLKNIKTVGSEDLGCKVESPWISAIRSFSKTSTEAKILDRVLILKSMISPKEIASSEFVEFQAKLIACFRSNILIFNQK
jgi:transglutaminase-like putative cysteine protease